MALVWRHTTRHQIHVQPNDQGGHFPIRSIDDDGDDDDDDHQTKTKSTVIIINLSCSLFVVYTIRHHTFTRLGVWNGQIPEKYRTSARNPIAIVDDSHKLFFSRTIIVAHTFFVRGGHIQDETSIVVFKPPNDHIRMCKCV